MVIRSVLHGNRPCDDSYLRTNQTHQKTPPSLTTKEVVQRQMTLILVNHFGNLRLPFGLARPRPGFYPKPPSSGPFASHLAKRGKPFHDFPNTESPCRASL